MIWVQYTPKAEHSVVKGRAARMIRWLCDHETEVNDVAKGEIRFCFAGESLAVHTSVVDTKV
jgi:hypothetical protein